MKLGLAVLLLFLSIFNEFVLIDLRGLLNCIPNINCNFDVNLTQRRVPPRGVLRRRRRHRRVSEMCFLPPAAVLPFGHANGLDFIASDYR